MQHHHLTNSPTAGGPQTKVVAVLVGGRKVKQGQPCENNYATYLRQDDARDWARNRMA